MEPMHTLADIVQYIEKSYSNPKAFNFLENGQWRSISTEAFVFDIKRLALGLISLGLKKGDTVGILAESSPYWNIADFAIVMAGGVSVPLFAKISHENFIYECAQANIRFIFVQGHDQWAMYEEHRNLFEQVIGLDDPGEVTGAIQYYDVLQMGEALWEKNTSLWEELAHKVSADDICTIIYTAGSTGMPKGVQLTNQNLSHLVSYEVFGWDRASDKYLSILPLAHIFARQINLILITWNISIYYLNDLSLMPRVCREIEPSLMIVVPRVLERMYSGIESNIRSSQNGIIKTIAAWGFGLASDPSKNVFKKYILRPLAEFLVYKNLRKAIGGKWRVILSGGAALDKTLNHFYLNIGIPVYQGWGLTETSTAVVNSPDHHKVGTVGVPLPGVKITIDENGEILVSGPTVMKGYYRNPGATSAVIDPGGWLHTGDKGEIDKDGYLKITGLVKEQFKLSSGEYLSPGRIEHMLCQHPLVDMAMAIGQKRKYAACLLFPEGAALKRMKKEKQMEQLSDEDFLQTPLVKTEIEELLKKVNRKTNAWEKLVKYRFILEPLTIEGGDLTPTLKLKRDHILQKYHKLIDRIYAEETK